MDFISLESINPGIQKARRWFQVWYSRIYHGDSPSPPSDILHLSPLTSLHSTTAHNMKLPQSGESRPVLPPSQRTISRQLMRSWSPWKTTIDVISNTRILEKLVLHTPRTIHSTNEQDLNLRTCVINDHPSVLSEIQKEIWKEIQKTTRFPQSDVTCSKNRFRKCVTRRVTFYSQ